MNYLKGICRASCLFLPALMFISCEKENIVFGDTDSELDPNVTYFDNYKADIATYKVDSFMTSSNEVMAIGYHQDPVFGVVKAGSYAQLSLPSSNTIAAATQPVVFDSLELIINSSGQFYGDSTRPVKINVHSLTENINDPVNGDYYYNTTSFKYNSSAIGQATISLAGRTGTAVHIRLSDALGQEWFNKFKSSSDEVSSQEKFINYFKGIFINTDSTVTNALAYFNVKADSMLVRLSYHENGTVPVAKQLDFSYTRVRQFNNISFRHTNSDFSAFVNKKTQVIPSSSSGNKSFLNPNLGVSIKISFPTLLALKELHPYIKVIKAMLVIKPDRTSYTFPYQLPTELHMYQTDDANVLGLGIYENTTLQTFQTGNLVIDHLYGENTYYSYDITSFINTKIGEGQFSKSALLLYTSLTSFDAGAQRLVINDQNNNGAIQLKLYVIGL